jgi:hypothetical protein
VRRYTVVSRSTGREITRAYQRPSAAVAYINRPYWGDTARADMYVREDIYSLVASGEYTPKRKKAR